ncbi:ketoacyl-ACP synthase III [candidate division WOR-3 bacterium]|nr:ketoacyl-ACP synthase III [candidate division WOR-3 bacterium]
MEENMRRVAIVGTGSYAPEKILTNDDIAKIVDTSDEWIKTRTGVKERRVVGEGEATSDIATEAARRALQSANIESGDVDLIIVATSTPDFFFPATACIVQHNIGAKNAAAFDLEAACSGFLYSLSIGNSLISTGVYDNILIIGAEVFYNFLDWEDRTTCVLFGDGAGAAILRPTMKENCIIANYLGADGSGKDTIKFPAGGSRLPASQETVIQKLHYVKMRGNETFKFAVRAMSDSVLTVLKQCDISLKEVDWLIPHQANIRIMRAVADRISLPREKVIINIDRYGNTSAASIPIALDEVVRDGKIKEGDIIVMVAFGAGLTWASSVVRW